MSKFPISIRALQGTPIPDADLLGAVRRVMLMAESNPDWKKGIVLVTGIDTEYGRAACQITHKGHGYDVLFGRWADIVEAKDGQNRIR